MPVYVYDQLQNVEQLGYPSNPMKTGNPLTGTLVDSEDPDVTPLQAFWQTVKTQNVIFHQGLHCLLR